MTLKEEQILQLRRALNNKGIAYQELEDELLDHVASETEKIMEADGISFFEASKKAFQQFGPHGLRPIQRNFEKSLTKQARQLYLKQASLYLLSHKILLTVSIFMLSLAGILVLPKWMINIFESVWVGLFLIAIGSYLWSQQTINLESHRSLANNIFKGIHTLNMVILLLLILIPEDFLANRPFFPGMGSFLLVVLHLIYLEALFFTKRNKLAVGPGLML